MQDSRRWSIGRAASLGLAISLITSVALPMLPGDQQSTVLASVMSGKDDNNKDKDREKERREKAENEDRVINGQVLEIDTLKNPPEIVLGSVDGQTIVRVLKTDEISLNGVHLGDYIEADGEKIHEQLFEATQISVSSRYSGELSDNDNKN
jgi:hypothetical protein